MNEQKQLIIVFVKCVTKTRRAQAGPVAAQRSTMFSEGQEVPNECEADEDDNCKLTIFIIVLRLLIRRGKPRHLLLQEKANVAVCAAKKLVSLCHANNN